MKIERIEDVFAEVIKQNYNLSSYPGAKADEFSHKLIELVIHNLINKNTNIYFTTNLDDNFEINFTNYMIAREYRNALFTIYSSSKTTIALSFNEDEDLKAIRSLCEHATQNKAIIESIVDSSAEIKPEIRDLHRQEFVKTTILIIQKFGNFIENHITNEYVLVNSIQEADKVATLSTELQNIKISIEDAQISVATLQTKITNAQKDIYEAKTEIANAKADANTAKADVEIAKKNIETAENRVKTAEDRVTVALNDIKNTSNSIIANSITLIGIFVAIIIATFGSFELVNGAGNFFGNLSLFALYAVIIGLIIFNITSLLLFFIAKITEKDFGVGKSVTGNMCQKFFRRYPHVYIPNIILIGLIFLLLYINFYVTRIYHIP